MCEESEEFRRCVIYAFWDQDGYVDGYVYKVLEALKEVAERIVFVSNGVLQEGSKRKLLDAGMTVLERENKGLDIWAYRTGMMELGWETLCVYDEVLLTNNSVMGPVRPLEEVFHSMQKKNVDFWGMSRHPEIRDKMYDTANDYGYLPEHVQSWFTVFRRSIICSYEFQFYWEHLPMIETYEDAVLRHEVIFTKYFADMGFSWDVYLHTEDIDYLADNLTLFYPKMLIEKYGCPFFKRKAFCVSYRDIIQNTVGQEALELYEYLDENHLYDMNLIWDNLLRTCNLYDLFQNMHLNYTLSTRMSHRQEIRQILKKKKAALIIHIYYIDMLDDTYQYVSQMPDVCDIYITTNSERTKRAVEEKFKDLNCNHMEIRLIPNRGRDVSALLVGVKDIVANYEYLCFAHDKKSSQVRGSIGESFNYKCFEKPFLK
ncbi:MAG: rhamnan synthesis F family protein [Lachnospiraceae bacterium]|nr:rhamnan synthesis F family protein [Lachnospiraceae bacterium]